MIKSNFNRKNLVLKDNPKEHISLTQSPCGEDQGRLYDLVTYALCILGILWVIALISGTFNSLSISTALDFITKK